MAAFPSNLTALAQGGAGTPPTAPPPSPAGMGGPAGMPQMPMGMMLAFLAGMGLPQLAQTIEKMKKTQEGPTGQGPTRAHRAGVRVEAAANPGMTIAPMLAQMIARRGMQ